MGEVGAHKSQNGLEKENRELREFIFSFRCEKGEMMLARRRRGQSAWSPDTSGVKYYDGNWLPRETFACSH